MKRESGRRRASLVTGVLVAASLAGTAAVAVAAHASGSASSTGEDSTSTSTSSSTDQSGTADSPALTGSDGGGQATSGGS